MRSPVPPIRPTTFEACLAACDVRTRSRRAEIARLAPRANRWPGRSRQRCRDRIARLLAAGVGGGSAAAARLAAEAAEDLADVAEEAHPAATAATAAATAAAAAAAAAAIAAAAGAGGAARGAGATAADALLEE